MFPSVLPEVVELLGHHAILCVEDNFLVRAGHCDVLAGPGHRIRRDGVNHDLTLHTDSHWLLNLVKERLNNLLERQISNPLQLI